MKFITISSIALVFLHQVFAKPAPGCLQTYTVTDNDDCYSVAQRFQLSEKEFYGMNPGLHHSAQHMCDNLDTGKPYCVCMNTPCASFHTNSTTIRLPTAIPSATKLVSHSASASHSASGVISPAATHLSTNSSSSSPSAHATATISPVSKSLENGNESYTSSATTIKSFGVFAVGLVMASASALL